MAKAIRFSTMRHAGIGLALLALSAPAMAQSTDASMWVAEPKSTGGVSTQYRHKLDDNVALIAAQNLDANKIASFNRAFEPICPGLSTAAPSTLFGGQLTMHTVNVGGATGCSLGLYQANGSQHAVLVIRAAASTFATGEAVQQWAAQFIGRAPAPSVATTSAGGSAPSARPISSRAGTPSGQANLTAALATVPQANRPVALVMRSEWRSGGDMGHSSFFPWLLFSNGVATDGECYGWDPAVTVPTQQSLANAGLDCTIERWRKVGGGYQFQDSDGSWSDTERASEFYPFPKGKRIDTTMTTQDGSGSTMGTVSVNIISEGGLRFTPAGRVELGASSDTWFRGDQRAGSRSNIVGRYEVDGYIIAIEDADGRVTRGFVAGADTDGRMTHIYLNGTLYWVPGANGG